MDVAPAIGDASWIWPAETPTGVNAMGHVRRRFMLETTPTAAEIALTADNGYELFVNNEPVAAELSHSGSSWGSIERINIIDWLHPGDNTIAVRIHCLGGSAGLIAAVRVEQSSGEVVTALTGEDWLAIGATDGNWTEADFDDSLWKSAAIVGPMGHAPWGILAVPNTLTDVSTLVVDATLPGQVNIPALPGFSEPEDDFAWPEAVVFVEGREAVHSTPIATTKFSIPNTESWFEYDTPAPATMGRKLYVFRPGPGRDQAAPTLLYDAGEGLLACPAASYDGTEIVFAMKPADEKFLKLFSIQSDGTGLTRLTEGPWQDYDPCFLPDGRIVFASSRMGSRDEYHANTSRSLFFLNREAEFANERITPLTRHIVADSQPAVMADGRIAFIRNDNFLERAKVETRIHAVRPDGTGGQTIIGPDRGAIGYDRETGAEHPDRWLRNYGFGSPAPLTDGRVACLTHVGPVVTDVLLRTGVQGAIMPSDVWSYDFAPTPDGRLLVSTLQGELGVLDPDTGYAVRLLTKPGAILHSVEFLGERGSTQGRPVDTVPYGDEDDPVPSGLLLCVNIFDSQQIEADWDRVKSVRIFQGKPLTLRAAQHQYGHIGTEGVELGTAPIAPDGSFFVRVPADRAIAIQAIDGEGRPIVTEMSWIYVRPDETRSCTGCHSPRQSTPTFTRAYPMASLTEPVDLTHRTGQIRFRANNAANGAVLNQQMDRFREVAGIDLYAQMPWDVENVATRVPSRTAEIETLDSLLADQNVSTSERISACERLAMFRNRECGPVLIEALNDDSQRIRLAAAVALSACGDRRAVAPLMSALIDPDPNVAQSAHLALSNLTGADVEFEAYDRRIPPAERGKVWDAWAARLEAIGWDAWEQTLIERLADESPNVRQLAIESLGHIGDAAACDALRTYVADGPKDSLLCRLAAMRALGHLQDEQAVELLGDILDASTVKTDLAPQKSHEFGWAASPDHLGGAAAEALGRIGTPEAETRLIGAYKSLVEFWYYTFRIADHNWLMGCHSSIIHYRIVESLEAMGSQNAAPLTDALLRSIPIDTDRGLLYEDDNYETIVARLVQRNGTDGAAIETCLSVLGDPEAVADPLLLEAVTASPPAVSVLPLAPESRAAQILCVLVSREEDAPRIRAALERYRANEASRIRCWVAFFLARSLGKLEDADSAPLLASILVEDPTEFSYGLPEPPNVFIHNAMTPTYRAAAADSLGRIGDPTHVEALFTALNDYDNAMDVRQAAAEALKRMVSADAELAETLEFRLEDAANSYPEIVTGQSLLEALEAARIAMEE